MEKSNKVFSVTSFGTNQRYIVGVYRQYELVQKFFPGWQFRVYTDDARKFCDLSDAVVVEIKDGSYGVFWRLFPLFESDANITIVRDADSRITHREAMAVSEWLASDKRLHIILDHQSHLRMPIMAGLFGLKGKLDLKHQQHVSGWLYGAHSYGADEVYLRDVVYNDFVDDCLTHKINDGWFGATRHKLINRYEFCGNGFTEHDMPIYPPTAEEFGGYDYNTLPDTVKFSGGLINGTIQNNW